MEHVLVMNIAHSLNILGGFFLLSNLILMYFRQPEHERSITLHRHHLFMTCISNVIMSLGAVVFINLDLVNTPVLCKIQTIWNTSWNISSIFWCCCLCLNILISASFLTNINKYKWTQIVLSHFVCWGLPCISLITLSVLPREIFTFVRGYCWINVEFWYLRFLLYYNFIILCWIFNFVVLIVLLVKLFRMRFMTEHLIQALSSRVIVYSMVFVLSWILGLTIRFIQIFNPTWHVPSLSLINSFLINSNAFFFALAFIYCENLMTEYESGFGKFKKILFCEK
jgi:hypothetical protein